MNISLRANRASLNDKVAVRDGTGIWKPAVVTEVSSDRFVATFVQNAGPDTITIIYNGTVPWRHQDAAVSA